MGVSLNTSTTTKATCVKKSPTQGASHRSTSAPPRGPQSVRTVAPAAPAPRPSLLSQFITCSSSHWPCLCSKQFQVPASLAGVRAVSRVLGFTAWAHYSHDTESGCGVYVVFHVWVAFISWLCLLALAPLGHTPLALWSPRIMEGSRCERSGVSRFGCCHQPWQVMAVLRAEKPQ